MQPSPPVLCAQLPCRAEEVRHGFLGSTAPIGAPMMQVAPPPPTSWQVRRQRKIAAAGLLCTGRMACLFANLLADPFP